MKAKILNFRKLFNPSNLIYSYDGLSKDNSFDSQGIYSEEIYGRMYGESIFSCSCGETRGAPHEELICESCGTPVKSLPAKITIMGWIPLKSNIINPTFMPMLQKYIGKPRLKRYLEPNYQVNIDGHIIDNTSIYAEDPKEPFPELVGKGVSVFIENMWRVIETIHASNSKNEDVATYQFLKEHAEDIVFDHIPVYSSRLRPAIMVAGNLIFDKVNTLFTQIAKCASVLRSFPVVPEGQIDPSKEKLIYKIQSLNYQVYDHVIRTISGKSGFIRNSLLGNRLNFSSRCVVVPLPPKTAMDEVHLPYLCALELLKVHIIRYLVKGFGISYDEAHMKWSQATTTFDRQVYRVINNVIADMPYGMRVLINRNPTINIGSILSVRVTYIKEDIDDTTMSISNNILTSLGADYDGDVINIFLLISLYQIKYFESLNPVKLYSISCNDGKFNAMLEKDYMLGIHTLID